MAGSVEMEVPADELMADSVEMEVSADELMAGSVEMEVPATSFCFRGLLSLDPIGRPIF